MSDPDPLLQILVTYLSGGEANERIIAFHDANLDPMRIFPASHSHHHCYPGGYYEHVLEVANNALTIFPLCVLEECCFTLEEVIIAVYFHDDFLFLNIGPIEPGDFAPPDSGEGGNRIKRAHLLVSDL